MAFDFPSTSLVIGYKYGNYTWDGEKWELPTSVEPPPEDAALNFTELFGISHPDQLLYLQDQAGPLNKVLQDGVEVPYQIDGTTVIVRANGGIDPNEIINWEVTHDTPGSVFADQVWITDTGTYYEIDNGIVAARIPKVIPCPTPATWVSAPEPRYRVNRPSQILAPIQGVRHRNGTWTGAGPNYLYDWQAWAPDESSFGSQNWPATEPALIEIIENGPLRVKMRVTYTGLRPHYYTSGPGFYVLYVASSEDAFYTCTITLAAGQETINFEQETNTRTNWWVNLNTGVSANRGRFKGHFVVNLVDGHNYDGTIYNNNSAGEAEANLNEAGVRSSNDWTGAAWVGGSGVFYQGIDHWWEWSTNGSGMLWYLFNSAGAADSNMWSLIQGRASYDKRFSETGVYGKPATGTPTELGFYTHCGVELTPTGIPGTDSKVGFNLFFGTKGEDVPVDFSAKAMYVPANAGDHPVYPSGAAKAHNFCSGAAQAWKQLNYGLDFPDPEGGYPGMHLTRAETEALIANLEADQGAGSHYSELYANDASYRDVWDAFANVAGTNAAAVAVVDYCLAYIKCGVDNFVNKGSIGEPYWLYWQGGLRFQEMAIRAMAMISLDQVRPFLTLLQKRQLKAMLSTIGHTVWDDDFVPGENSEFGQFTFGNANMPVQYNEQKNQFTAILKTHPQFIDRFATVLDRVTTAFNANVVASGAPRNNPHYAGAMTVPILDVFRQLQVSGYTDVFAPGSSVYARLVLLGEWYLQLMTPPQNRFLQSGTGLPMRKVPPYGDGASENINQQIALIMGFVDTNPTLSKRLAWMWINMGKMLTSFYSSTGLKIVPSEELLTQDPALGDADFAGSFTVFRNSWGTADESAVFLHHGYANTDHCGFERGAPAIYLLGSPISIPFGSMYTPVFPGPWLGASTYIPVSQLDTGGGGGLYPTLVWNTYTAIDLACGDHSSYFDDTYTHSFTTLRCDVTCNFAVSGWVRQMTYYRDDLAMPVVRFRDADTATGDSIYTLHVMATGSYKRPDGSTAVEPTTLNGTTFAITNGQHFEFTGQQWGVSPSVSVDVYYFGPPAEAFVGFFKHNWHPTEETIQYGNATALAFEEKQYILRIKTSGPCDTVIVPYRTRPPGLNVTQTGGGNLNLATTAVPIRSLPN